MIEDLRKANDAPKVTGGRIPNGKDLNRRHRRGDFPPGVVIRLGGRVYFDERKLLAYLESGGGKPGAFAGRG